MQLVQEIPYVAKQPVSIVVVGNTANEAQAIRAVLEVMDFHVEIHWTGSRNEFLKTLLGEIRTHEYIVLSCHGDEQGIIVPDEPTITSEELYAVVKLDNRTVINTGCLTGVESLGKAFSNGCQYYIAPSDYVHGDAALLFVLHLFYHLKNGRSILEASDHAKQFDSECGLSNLYRKEHRQI